MSRSGLRLGCRSQAEHRAAALQFAFRKKIEWYLPDPKQFILDFGDSPEVVDAAEGIADAALETVGMKAEVASDLRRVFDADEPAEAERRLRDVVARYQKPSPSFESPPPAGGGSERPTGWNGSTKRSNEGRESPRSSRTKPRSCDSPPPSSPRSVTTGKQNVPT